jgi:hypothetical protein
MSGVEIKTINVEGGGRRRSLMVHVSRADDEERRGSLSRGTLGQSLRDRTMWEGEKDRNKGHVSNQETWKAVVEYKKTLL